MVSACSLNYLPTDPVPLFRVTLPVSFQADLFLLYQISHLCSSHKVIKNNVLQSFSGWSINVYTGRNLGKVICGNSDVTLVLHPRV